MGFRSIFGFATDNFPDIQSWEDFTQKDLDHTKLSFIQTKMSFDEFKKTLNKDHKMTGIKDKQQFLNLAVNKIYNDLKNKSLVNAMALPIAQNYHNTPLKNAQELPIAPSHKINRLSPSQKNIRISSNEIRNPVFLPPVPKHPIVLKSSKTGGKTRRVKKTKSDTKKHKRKISHKIF